MTINLQISDLKLICIENFADVVNCKDEKWTKGII